MESTAQTEANLLNQASKELNQGGYNVTPQELNPHDHSPLERIKEALGAGVNIVGSEVMERLTGQGPETHVGVTKGGKLARWVLERFRRKQK